MKNIQEKLNKYDNQLIYVSGYKNCNSVVKCYCKRCNNYFERRWSNISRHNTDYSCPICQTKLGQERAKENVYIKPLEEREQHFKEIIEKTQPTFKYISGFEDNHSYVVLECKICGDRFTKQVETLMRKNRPVVCLNCKKIANNEIRQIINNRKKMIKEQQTYIRKLQQLHIKEIKNLYKLLRQNTVYIKTCKCCEEEYIENTNSKYCAKCRKKIRKKHSYKSLKALYERDKGICQLCGTKCNWNDKKEINGATIVGNTYPSIDHILPISKGGTDEWENLQLAHFKCNWVKGA